MIADDTDGEVAPKVPSAILDVAAIWDESGNAMTDVIGTVLVTRIGTRNETRKGIATGIEIGSVEPSALTEAVGGIGQEALAPMDESVVMSEKKTRSGIDGRMRAIGSEGGTKRMKTVIVERNAAMIEIGGRSDHVVMNEMIVIETGIKIVTEKIAIVMVALWRSSRRNRT